LINLLLSLKSPNQYPSKIKSFPKSPLLKKNQKYQLLKLNLRLRNALAPNQSASSFTASALLAAEFVALTADASDAATQRTTKKRSSNQRMKSLKETLRPS
jgi:hypothetical protein